MNHKRTNITWLLIIVLVYGLLRTFGERLFYFDLSFTLPLLIVAAALIFMARTHR